MANAPNPPADLEAFDAGPFLSVAPLTEAADDWIAENVDADAWQYIGSAMMVDHRYGPDLLAGAIGAGLVVTLHGQRITLQ